MKLLRGKGSKDDGNTEDKERQETKESVGTGKMLVLLLEFFALGSNFFLIDFS
jgi:hypothetical protein